MLKPTTRASVPVGVVPVLQSDTLSFLLQVDGASVNEVTGLGRLSPQWGRLRLSEQDDTGKQHYWVSRNEVGAGWGTNKLINWRGIRLSDGRGRTQHSYPLESLP